MIENTTTLISGATHQINQGFLSIKSIDVKVEHKKFAPNTTKSEKYVAP